MKLLSNDLKAGEEMAREFTCDGSNISPELHWQDAPAETKSFALVLSDPDAPGGTFYHWLVYNIPAATTNIAQGSVPVGAKQIANDFGKEGYGGPCPPSGSHRYFFRLYALDVETLDCNNKQELLEQIEQHKLREASRL